MVPVKAYGILQPLPPRVTAFTEISTRSVSLETWNWKLKQQCKRTMSHRMLLSRLQLCNIYIYNTICQVRKPLTTTSSVNSTLVVFVVQYYIKHTVVTTEHLMVTHRTSFKSATDSDIHFFLHH